MKKLLIFILIIVILLISIIFVPLIHLYFIGESKKIDLIFPNDIKQELNELYNNQTVNTEFIGFLFIEDDVVYDFELAGTKEFLPTEKIYPENIIETSNITIHSHSYFCFPSYRDLYSMIEDVQCIMCGENKIKCFVK